MELLYTYFHPQTTHLVNKSSNYEYKGMLGSAITSLGRVRKIWMLNFHLNACK